MKEAKKIKQEILKMRYEEIYPQWRKKKLILPLFGGVEVKQHLRYAGVLHFGKLNATSKLAVDS